MDTTNAPMDNGSWFDVCERWLTGQPAGAVGAALVTEALADTPARLRTKIALTYAATAGGTQPRRTDPQSAATLGARLPGLCASLQEAGVAAVPLTARELTVAARVAYDPSVAALLDRNDPSVGPKWPDVTPLSSRDLWDHFRHDGACSVSWVASRSPRDDMSPGLGTPLLALPGQIAAQRLTFLYRSANRQRRSGEDNLAPFAAVATATVRHVDDLPRAAVAKEGLAAAVRVRLRRAYGAQAGTFATGLPLGVTSADGIKPPQVIRATG
ncbi:hypothetical protein LO772_32135 [Yinghuangia sp. ASG 101]|uniref:SCO6880 family protein n=1 Tax=Yinghuangia sp. ASG 101 TaxID=2896848 RepID=UPI001E38A4FB|nr:SCO6880 family protein [Yinghuangia sp. ASG 101]UGQ11392.1 hypothetical protein LO772_32135 [Yinghuangia sp. ASG 101]